MISAKVKELSGKHNKGRSIDIINQKLGYIVRCGDPDAIDAYLRSLPYLPTMPPGVGQHSTTGPQREGDYQCVTQNLTETRQFDRIVAHAANSDSLWPGAIVAGDSIYDGLFSQVGFERSPLTISVSLENLAGSKSARLEAPSLSSYREALAAILDAEIDGATAANIYSEIEPGARRCSADGQDRHRRYPRHEHVRQRYRPGIDVTADRELDLHRSS